MLKTTRQCRRCEKQIDLNLLGKSITNNKVRWTCVEPCKKASLRSQKVKVENKAVVASRLVITAAQDNTPVHTAFLRSLENYCRVNEAQLLVIPYRYRNPTSPIEAEKQDEEDWYDPSITKYLLDKRTDFAYISVLADLKINPTAVNPLSGLEALSGGKSIVVAHPQIAMQLVATPKGDLPLIMQTTGAITTPNYSNSKSGKKGEFHHSFGASIIELSRKDFHLRSVSAKNDGSFVDLGIEYTANSNNAIATEALVMGDLHIGSTCPRVTLATQKLIKQLKPSQIVLHDCFDGESVNHHEKNNPFAAFSHTFKSLEDELKTNANVLKHFRSQCQELVIVNSNHNDFLYRWLQSTDWKFLSPQDKQFYLRSALATTIDTNEDIYGKEMFKRGVFAQFLQLDQSYKVLDIELGYHGHTGTNGSRGSSRQYAKTGSKSVIGHSHTPGIVRGCYQVGTSTHLSLSYTKGLSSWLNTHCLIYGNGKRQLVHIIDGKYTFA